MADVVTISSSAIGVYQRALGVVSNNIANVGTEGYVRQDISVGQTPPTYDGRNFIGTGAVFNGVQRQYNAFIETSLRNATATLSGQTAMVNYANRVIDVMGSGEIGLSPALDRFFSAARALSSDPANPVVRTGVLREAEGVASRFQDLSSQLQQVETETQQSMISDLTEVNSLASQLARINVELSRNRSLDRQASALLDERDNVLRQLSDRLDIQVQEAENGVVNVTVGGAGSSGALVAAGVAKPLEARFDAQSPERLSVQLDPWGREPVSISGLTGGSFGGVASFRAMVLEPALSNLDLLAKSFMTEVNSVHEQGVDARGDAGQAMFAIQTSFTYERLRGINPMTIQAEVRDLAQFDGKDVTLTFDAQAGQVVSAALLGPFEEGDRFEVTLNGLSKLFAIGPDTRLDSVAQQLRQFIDGAFGVQLRTQVDPNGQVVVNSSVMKSFAFDIRLSSDQARVQLGQSQGLWVASNRAGERITGSTALDIDGITVNLQGQAVDGEQVTVTASSRPAAGLTALITDPLKIAAAAAFRATRDNDNLSTAHARVDDRIGQITSLPAAPVLGSAGGLPNNPVVSEARDWVAQRVVPFATVAAGQRDVALYLDPGSSQANLQILTRDGRHLLGTAQADGASFVANVTSLPAPFEPGSTYSADYLNKTGDLAYRDLSLFYGARALPTEIEVMGPDHVPVDRTIKNARLTAELEVTPGMVSIPAGALTLNGVTLPSRARMVNGLQDVADLLNDAITAARAATPLAQRPALDGVVAEVRDGLLELTRPAEAGLDGDRGQIRLGFGANGSPQLLSRLGFRTAAYLDGEMPEDLMVFTTGSGDVRVGASFAGAPWDVSARRTQLREAPLAVEFLAADRIRITETTTGTVLAERAYSAPAAIDYQGLRITFTEPAVAGDRFVLDGNRDGRGDNANARRLADLEQQAVAGAGQSLTISEAYLDVVDQLSNVTQQAQVASKAMEVVRQQAVEARESVSGVSLDEEAANLIRYQQAYQAAAKSMQVASQMFDAVLRI